MVGCIVGINNGKYKYFHLTITEMATNIFYCHVCCEMTRHVEISFREYVALDGDGFIGQAAALFGNVTGLERSFNTITGIKCWKCCKCGDHTRRKPNGEIYWGTSKPIY